MSGDKYKQNLESGITDIWVWVKYGITSLELGIKEFTKDEVLWLVDIDGLCTYKHTTKSLQPMNYDSKGQLK